MTQKVVYEWDVETVEIDGGNIIDHCHETKLSSLIKMYASVKPVRGTRFELCLVRDTWREDDLVDRLHCYPFEGPTFIFNHTERLIPLKYQMELIREWKKLEKIFDR